MPFADRDKQRKYQRERNAAARTEWFTANGPCVKCGSWEKLELDHKDPAQKERRYDHLVWSWTLDRREAELAKCQVLCRACHREKSNDELRRPLIHGTIAAYKGKWCRCDECRKAVREHQAAWRARTGKH